MGSYSNVGQGQPTLSPAIPRDRCLVVASAARTRTCLPDLELTTTASQIQANSSSQSSVGRCAALHSDHASGHSAATRQAAGYSTHRGLSQTQPIRRCLRDESRDLVKEPGALDPQVDGSARILHFPGLSAPRTVSFHVMDCMVCMHQGPARSRLLVDVRVTRRAAIRVRHAHRQLQTGTDSNADHGALER